MEEKNKIEVFIGGKVYKIAGKESEEYIQKVARHIDKKMMEISAAQRSTVLSSSMLAILTAINVGDDYFKIKQQNEQLLQRLAEMSSESVGNEKIEQYEQIIGQLQDENIALKEKLDKVLIELKNIREEFDEYLNEFGKGDISNNHKS